MKTTQQQCQQLAWQPKPAKKPEVENLYKEGKILPNAPEEEIELPSLMAVYSEKQLRVIKRRHSNLKFKKKNQQRVLRKEMMWEDVLYD